MLRPLLWLTGLEVSSYVQGVAICWKNVFTAAERYYACQKLRLSVEKLAVLVLNSLLVIHLNPQKRGLEKENFFYLLRKLTP